MTIDVRSSSNALIQGNGFFPPSNLGGESPDQTVLGVSIPIFSASHGALNSDEDLGEILSSNPRNVQRIEANNIAAASMAIGRPPTPFPTDDMLEWSEFVSGLKTLRGGQLETFSECDEDSECELTPTLELGQVAAEPTNHVLLERSVPALRNDITFKELNLEFLEIDKKYRIINILSKQKISEILSHDDINDYLKENGKLPDLTEEKIKLQELIKEFLIKVSDFVKSCEKQSEKIEHVRGLIDEISLFDDRCFIDSIGLKKSLKISKSVLNKILKGDSQTIKQQDQYNTEESSESDFSEVVLNWGGSLYYPYDKTPFASPAMTESSESLNGNVESVGDLSTDGSSLDSANAPSYTSDSLNSLDTVSKDYLSIVVNETIDSKRMGQICDTRNFLKRLKESNNRKIESGEKGFLDPKTQEYIDEALDELNDLLSFTNFDLG